MRLLLDTHILLWWLADDPALPASADALIGDPHNEVFASAITLWEIAIKARLGKITVDTAAVQAAVLASGFETLAFTAGHAIEVSHLPEHHRDPFDRALLAQARIEPLRLITHDTILALYGDQVLLV